MLTDSQRQMAEDNHNLIYQFLYDNHLGIEEWYDVAAIGLCKAAGAYEGDRAKFSTFAYHVMRNCVLAEKRKERAKMRQGVVVSIDTPFDNSEGSPTLGDTLISEQGISRLGDDDLSPKVQAFLAGLNEQSGHIVDLLFLGNSQTDIAAILGCSRQYVSLIVGRLREELREAGIRP